MSTSLDLISLDLISLEALYIDYKNIDEFTKFDYYPNLRELRYYSNRKLNFDFYPNILRLICIRNSFTELNINHCNLVELQCDSNDLTNLDLSSCSNLEILSCDNNKITNLNLNHCDKLKKLSCVDNSITDIKLNCAKSLEILDCRCNLLTDLNVSSYSNLKKLYCSDNQLTSLNLSFCGLLEELDCSDNQLTSLNLTLCNNIHYLCIGDNNLTTLPLSNIQIRNLRNFYVYWNEIVYTPSQLRLLNLVNINEFSESCRFKSISENSQNIHDANISYCMLKSFDNILCNQNYKKCENVIDRIVEDENLDTNVKNILIQYSLDYSLHSTLNANFEQVLSYIYPLHDKNSLKILENEMLDSECQCFTGRMFRLINSLNGIIPEVNIKISLNQDLNNMASNIFHMNIDNAREVFLKNVLDKYPDIKETYLEPWLKDLD